MKAMGTALVGLVLMFPSTARAEGPMLLSGAFSVSLEGGDFGADVGTGYGFAAQSTYRFGGGPFGFRVSGVGTWHERRDRLVAVPPASAGAAPSGIETRQHVFSLVGGPQLTRRSGAVRPYGYALAGFAHFSASTLSGSVAGEEIQDDVFAWSLGGGVLIPLGELIRVDLGARYLGSGEATYPGARGFIFDGATPRATDRARLGQLELTAGLGLSF